MRAAVRSQTPVGLLVAKKYRIDSASNGPCKK